MRNSGYIYHDQVSAREAGVDPVTFYARKYRHSPAEAWQERVEAGRVSLNGRTATARDRLRAGDRLAWHRPPWEEPDAPLEFTTLREDDHVLVLGKPSGLPVLPGGGFLENTLLARVRHRFGAGASPVHRLGRGTSGAILFSRTPGAARTLGLAMADRRIRKTYLALAAGTGMPDTFTVDAPIGPVPHPLLPGLHAASPGGRPSLSHVTVIRRNPQDGTALLQVVIPTGRPHQIRIHLAFAGFPLAGDPLYGPGGLPRDRAVDDEREALPGDCGYRLHSWKIRFPHPAGTGEVEAVCPPPPELALQRDDGARPKDKRT
ncbi:MAG: RNA pseudouridine synthase [Acidobacteria bacterium]|nr:RNA pseudouridine synthase [Acidobacteriota bacterium]